MSSTKVQIYNLALSALLLASEISDTETDESLEVTILNTHWDVALETTLKDLDLDSTSEEVTLELIETLPTDHLWTYAYKYPTNAAFFRRLKSCVARDTKRTHIAKAVKIYNGVKVIFTDEASAVAEIIPKDVLIESLCSNAIMALSYKLAYLSAPLLVGKGAKTLRKEIKEDYIIEKIEAQETDTRENFVYEADYESSEWVQERMS